MEEYGTVGNGGVTTSNGDIAAYGNDQNVGTSAPAPAKSNWLDDLFGYVQMGVDDYAAYLNAQNQGRYYVNNAGQVINAGTGFAVTVPTTVRDPNAGMSLTTLLLIGGLIYALAKM